MHLNAPPSSLMNSTTNPKVKIAEKEKALIEISQNVTIPFTITCDL